MAITLGRPVLIVAESIPREEMRTFLEQCEPAVVATGDQSVAEAVLLGKVPMVRPDAKVSQWESALSIMSQDKVQDVPDLGERLRTVVRSREAQSSAARCSETESSQVSARVIAEFG